MEAVIKDKTNMSKLKVAIPIVVLVVLIGGVLLGKMYFGGNNGPSVNTVMTKQEANQDITDDRQNAITRVVSKVSDAIVGINVEEVQEVQNPFMDDPFFRQFFGSQLPGSKS